MAEIKFEQALQKLEKLVADLESGKFSLDESLKKYEEGVKLSRICSQRLEEARRKVEILVKSDTGELKAAPFDEELF